MKDKTLRRYLIWAFVLAWALQAAAIVLVHRGEPQGFRLVLALSMYAPFAAVLLAGIGLRGMGWKPRLKGKLRWVLAAWFVPALFTVLGAALYFVIFPSHFDASGSLLAAQLGEDGLAQLESAGMTLRTYALVQSAAALTWAPWLNMLAALGEEVGWRGALYPRLKARFGVGKGRLLGGLIWGVWHWPIMILAGYNYGTQYWGAPMLGPLVFCLGTVALGVLFDRLYEKTHCIWIPALAHGAYNAAAGLPSLFLASSGAQYSTLGPAPIGLIAGLPLLLLAALLWKKSEAPAA